MIQIIGLRQCAQTGKVSRTLVDKGYYPSTITELYTQINDVLAVIPIEERVDLFYTTHHVDEQACFTRCDAYTFEINGMDGFDGSSSHAMRVLAVVSEVFDVDVTSLGAAQNGATSLDVVLPLSERETITTLLQMEELLPIYVKMCAALESALRTAGFTSAKVNRQAWGVGKLMRVPCVLSTLGKEELSPLSTKNRASWAGLSVVN